MLRICHCADLHIRGLSRHDEMRDVFESLAQNCAKTNVDHIYIAGDIFHTKTSGISPEYIEFLTWTLKLLSNVAPVHMILGNHDGSLSNLSRQDAITPIVEALGNDRVKLYKKSGVYQIQPGYNWCVFSLFDQEGWEKVKPVPGDFNIACYHGPVQGAKSEQNWEFNDGLKVDFFKDYDLTLLGDIHHTQFLDFRDVELEIDENDLHKYPGADVLEVIETSDHE